MFEFNGKQYKSRTEAGIDLVNQGKSIKEAAILVGVSYQTIYVNTKGKENRQKLLSKLRAKKLLASNRSYSKAEIARRTGLSKKTISKICNEIKTVASEVVTSEDD